MSSYSRSLAGYLCLILVLSCIGILVRNAPVIGQAPTSLGGFIVKSYDPITRPRLTASQIQSFVPSTRGRFTFPAPYNTTGIRLTVPSDCGGTDCLHYVSYPYWKNMNNHVGSNTIYIFLAFNSANGGPSILSYDKTTDAVTKLGPLFAVGNPLRSEDGEGWYFSATNPTMLYLTHNWGGNLFRRVDIITKAVTTVFDIDNCTACGAPGTRAVWQAHSSDDDTVHAFTVAERANPANFLGCAVYKETTATFTYFPRVNSSYDECNLDKSGRWLVMLDATGQLDDYIRDLQTGLLYIIPGVQGSVAHLDMGNGYMVGGDGYNPLPNATVLIKFPPLLLIRPVGTDVQYNPDWSTGQANHVTHQNRKVGPPEQQYACGSNLDGVTSRENEIVCFRLDGSFDELIVAPVMSNINAAGGGDEYGKTPKGNLDVTGQYFIWTSNMGGNRLDAFLVKVPAHLLVGGQTDTTPPVAPTNLRAM